MQEHDPQDIHQIGPSDELKLEIVRRGSGPPLLLLPGEEALERDAPFLDELAKSYEVIIPSPPGFGRSTRPDWITGPDDIAYMMLDVVDELGLKNIPVIGFSFGGWIAAEMATKDDGFISKLVLVDPYGIKTGKPTEREIQDVWLLSPDEVMALKWHDAAKGKRDFKAMPEDALTIVARDRETLRALRLGALSAQSQAQAPAAPHQGADAADLGRERRHRHAAIRRGLSQADPGCAARGDPAGRPSAAHRAAAGVSR